MPCGKCGGLEVPIYYEDYFESHEAIKCLNCGRVRWVEAVSYSPPDQLDYLCDSAQ